VRNFKFEITALSFKKPSSDILHANAAEGKKENLLLSPNFDDPSARPVIVNKYFPIKP
jgi:hypothetical protein